MDIKKSITIMKALSDSSRLMVINSLMEKSQCLEELAERLNLASSTISFHLKKLEKAKLVVKEKQQYYVIFSINSDVFNYTLKDLTTFENIEKVVQEERIEKYRQKVLKTFFKDGRLMQLPAQHKKRWIVLNEIADDFELERNYSESEVNSIIAKYYEDYCTIRRELIEEGVMARDGYKYWMNKQRSTESIRLRPNIKPF